VHEFDGNGRNEVISSTRSETRTVNFIKQFVIEPWVVPRVKTAVMLDDKNDRVLFIGKHTMQLWLWSNFQENRTLQYIWCRPIINKIEKKILLKNILLSGQS